MFEESGVLYEHFTMADAGTETISIAANESARVVFIDISANADIGATVKVGSEIVWSGYLANTGPVQLNFGKGRSSGNFGDDITIEVDAGTAEIFIGYKKDVR
jgi:hypothetical protein